MIDVGLQVTKKLRYKKRSSNVQKEMKKRKTANSSGVGLSLGTYGALFDSPPSAAKFPTHELKRREKKTYSYKYLHK